jgi:secreted trypsin-like serine protease
MGWIPIAGEWWNPRYSKNSYANDIGLVLLDSPASVQTLPLPNASQIKAVATLKTFTLYGWGVDQNGDSPAVLQSAVLNDQTTAAKQYFKSFFNASTMIAAGYYNKSERVYSGACNGDSGAPLIGYLKGKPVLIGVTSYGANDCDTAKPTVFAKVSYFIKDLASGEIRLRS